MTAGRLPDDWALPAITPVNEAWFTTGELAVQRCEECRTAQHPPEELCRSCGATAFTYEAVRPLGTIHSFTIAHYAVHPALRESVPYAVVLVSLDDAPHIRVVGNMPDTPPEEVRIGLPVEAVWEERKSDDGSLVLLPQWVRARRDT